ncbi:DoxX family protein [Neisseria cinerea]|uniref:DoxX family protein n=1 Tax=Neisseria cinerea ATCC 14685 TaxID=546262 RepID=D0W3Q7_NEICI|nr:DoxX family protein [Neisseria cinerea]EEZ71455.1 DoxX family protein [Neisseria cinerea ATCC 14685]MCD2070868.1 DoxX family protein [Neisseria cinerea]
MSNCCNRIQPVLLSVLRIVTAYLFLLHGTSKFFAFPIEMGSGSPEGLMLVAGILEIVGGILLVLGLFTRPAAFVLSGQMAVAYFMAHASGNTLFPIANGGESAVLFCFVFFYIAAAGGGAWSLDRLFFKRKA